MNIEKNQNMENREVQNKKGPKFKVAHTRPNDNDIYVVHSRPIRAYIKRVKKLLEDG